LRLFAVILSTATVALASAATAQPTAGPVTDDAKCLLEMVALSNSSTPEAQHIGQDGVVFFVGRLSAHDPNFDFMRLKAMSQTLTPQTAQADLQQRCAPMLQHHMQQLGAALGGPPPAAPPNAH
jgi:hypothetical protein